MQPLLKILFPIKIEKKKDYIYAIKYILDNPKWFMVQLLLPIRPNSACNIYIFFCPRLMFQLWHSQTVPEQTYVCSI